MFQRSSVCLISFGRLHLGNGTPSTDSPGIRRTFHGGGLAALPCSRRLEESHNTYCAAGNPDSSCGNVVRFSVQGADESYWLHSGGDNCSFYDGHAKWLGMGPLRGAAVWHYRPAVDRQNTAISRPGVYFRSNPFA